MNKARFFGKEWIFEGFLPGGKICSLQGFAVEREIFNAKTPYQDLYIFENEKYGRMLMLNGLVQLAEVGEEVYHEMLVHPALMLQENPERVMIIGGGDGGALREVVNHPVKEVVMVEIDQGVIDASKKYLPSLSRGAFEDERVTLVIEDAIKVVSQYQDYFDCIVMDSNDPGGEMAEGLFFPSFFQKIKNALKKDGIFILQTGVQQDAFGKIARKNLALLFPFVWMHRAYVEYYMAGEHTFSLASGTDWRRIGKKTLEKTLRKRNLSTSYYSTAMHKATAVLPKYLKDALG